MIKNINNYNKKTIILENIYLVGLPSTPLSYPVYNYQE